MLKMLEASLKGNLCPGNLYPYPNNIRQRGLWYQVYYESLSYHYFHFRTSMVF